MCRFLTAFVAFALPLVSLAADDARPACNSHNQGQLWPQAANHDSKLLAHFVRCGELWMCVRGTWHYHWESPTVRVDQLRGAESKAAKPLACEEDSAVADPQGKPAPANGFR
jgi:hypothetical protein